MTAENKLLIYKQTHHAVKGKPELTGSSLTGFSMGFTFTPLGTTDHHLLLPATTEADQETVLVHRLFECFIFQATAALIFNISPYQTHNCCHCADIEWLVTSCCEAWSRGLLFKSCFGWWLSNSSMGRENGPQHSCLTPPLIKHWDIQNVFTELIEKDRLCCWSHIYELSSELPIPTLIFYINLSL